MDIKRLFSVASCKETRAKIGPEAVEMRARRTGTAVALDWVQRNRPRSPIYFI